ncbi:LysE family transporter [Clostridium oceanicum]|uniref:LysE family transporter n=1 Tax=Clostridium oceanicum TaxID=1543 RepID=A0ABP3UPL0_9CLOT
MFSIAGFLFYVIINTFTPGPVNIMAMTNGSYFGYRKSLRFMLGVIIGFIIIMITCSYLNLFLASIFPKAEKLMNVLGFCYMIYLSIKIMKSDSKETVGKYREINTFTTGIFIQLMNPKLILFGMTVTSSFIVPYYQSNIHLILFTVLMASIGFIALSTWVIFGFLLQNIISKHRKKFNIIMAILLIYSASSLINIEDIINLI